MISLYAVGALTAKGPLPSSAGARTVEHSFRPWELKSIDSIDLRDSSLGSVRYQVRGGQIMRILPRVNDQINGEWATDKGRYAPVDGVYVQECRNPTIENQVIKLSTALKEISKITGTIRVLYGATTDCESIDQLTKWSINNKASLETISTHNIDNNPINLFNVRDTKDSFLSNDENQVLLIGCDPRTQSPLLNVQLRERYLNGVEYHGIGGNVDLTYPFQHKGLGGTSEILAQDKLNNSYDTIIRGSDLYRRKDVKEQLKVLKKITGDTKVRVCTTRANETYIRNHPHTKSFNSKRNYDLQLLVNVSLNEIESAGYKRNEVLSKGKYNIVITNKGADWMKEVNRVLPIKNSLETKSTYISRITGTRVSEKVIVRDDGVLSLNELISIRPNRRNLNSKSESIDSTVDTTNISNVPLLSSRVDYHREGHPFAECSRIMGRCSGVFTQHRSNFI